MFRDWLVSVKVFAGFSEPCWCHIQEFGQGCPQGIVIAELADCPHFSYKEGASRAIAPSPEYPAALPTSCMNSALIVQDLGGKAEGGDSICTGLEEPLPLLGASLPVGEL